MRKYIYKFGLTLLITFHLVNIFNWLNLHVWPVGKDCFRHLYNVSYMLNSEHIWKNLLFVDMDYPPFYYWTAMVLMKIFSGSYQAVFLNSTLFLMFLILATYGIGKKLKNKQVAFLAACICVLFPSVYKGSIQFNLELSSAAMTSLIIYNILASDAFNDRFYSFLVGVTLGFGLLTRAFIPLFIIGPTIFILFDFKRKQHESGRLLKKQQLINIAIAFCVSIGIGFIFYHTPEAFTSIVQRTSYEGKIAETSIFSKTHLLFYARSLPEQIGIWGTIAFLISFYGFLKMPLFIKQLLISWILLPYVVLSFIFLKHTEYTMPYLPAVALIIALTIDKIKPELIKKSVATLVIVIGFCQYFKNF